jgi:hypothetical protein
MNTLKTKASLEKVDKFLKVSLTFVHLDEGREFLSYAD